MLRAVEEPWMDFLLPGAVLGYGDESDVSPLPCRVEGHNTLLLLTADQVTGSWALSLNSHSSS